MNPIDASPRLPPSAIYTPRRATCPATAALLGRLLPSIVAAAVLAGAGVNRAVAQTGATWTAAGNGNWSLGGNWTTSPVYPDNGAPNPADTYNALFNTSPTVTLTEDITIQQLVVSAGLTINGAFTLNLNNGFNFSGVNTKAFSGVTLDLDGGTGVWSAGNLTLANVRG